ncbi:TRAP transporter small permease [Pseudopelagicola sp. nBUS_20]|uniref:TRAP transporter small permease n=1 Tax=Pseudopelagicola sp. nBUS_20 TaxID=3395317 RepID=UPI003EBF6F45
MQRTMEKAARYTAVAGGIVLTLLILITCLSVLGRSLNGMFHGWVGQVLPGLSKWALDMGVGPITGDFELVEAGVAFAVFASLPLCQINSGHASVDIFAKSFPPRLSLFLTMVTEILFALVLILIAWRLFDGMLSKRRYGETTFLLQFPIWWAYALSFVGAVMAAIAGIYMAAKRTGEFLFRHKQGECEVERET